MPHLTYTPPELLYHDDDGTFPNSTLPVLYYRAVSGLQGAEAAAWLEQRFDRHQWRNSWRWEIYPYHHYHSNTHEVLGVYQGQATLQLGGPAGTRLPVAPGDVLILPAGTAHRCIERTPDFRVVGAYPDGREPDLCKGAQADRPQADERILQTPVPQTDPLWGLSYGLRQLWR